MKKFLFRGLIFSLQFLLIIAVGYVCLEWLMASIIHSHKEVTVPNLVGKNLYQSAEALSALGLGLIKETDENNPDVAVGVIVKQYPLAGSKLREGSLVRAVISLGGAKITVPEITGIALRKAEIELKLAELILGETDERYSLEAPRGTVIEQDPSALSLADKGEIVNLVISKGAPGPDYVIAPNFVGKDLNIALEWCQKYGLETAIVEDWTTTGVDNTVLEQNIQLDTLWKKRELENLKPVFKFSVARQALAKNVKYLDFRVPAKPKRRRALMIKASTQTGDKELLKIDAEPGQTVKIPLPAESSQIKKIRIYLDGVFTEEKSIP